MNKKELFSILCEHLDKKYSEARLLSRTVAKNISTYSRKSAYKSDISEQFVKELKRDINKLIWNINKEYVSIEHFLSNIESENPYGCGCFNLKLLNDLFKLGE